MDGTPTFTSGMPMRAWSEAMRRSHDSASSMPPPRHQPGMRAITGARNSRTPSHNCRRRSMYAMALAWSKNAISLMSEPATKAFSCSARSTSTFTSSRWSMCASMAIRLSTTAALRMFSLPASRISSVPTPSSRSEKAAWARVGISMAMVILEFFETDVVYDFLPHGVGPLDHAGKLLARGVVWHGAQAFDVGGHFRVGQGLLHGLVQLVEHGVGRACRRGQAEPRRRVQLRIAG